jgi:hypothetical protein
MATCFFLFLCLTGCINFSHTIIPLVSKPSSNKAIIFQGEKVVQACNLIIPEIIVQKTGLIISPSDGIVRSYFDGKGKGELTPKYDKDSSSIIAINTCTYNLAQDYNSLKSSVYIEVFQSSYSQESAIQHEIQTMYYPISVIEGIKVFKYKDSSSGSYFNSEYFLQKKGIYIRLSFKKGHKQLQQQENSLLKIVAKNLSSQSINPDGPLRFVPKESLLTDYANSCELTDNNDFQKVMGVDAHPIVVESIAAGSWTLRSSVLLDEQPFYFPKYKVVYDDCTRQISLDEDSMTNLLISIATFESERAAKIAFGKGGEESQLIDSIGDGARFSGYFKEISFRKGKMVVTLQLDYPLTNRSESEVMEKLIPLAKDLDKRIK